MAHLYVIFSCVFVTFPCVVLCLLYRFLIFVFFLTLFSFPKEDFQFNLLLSPYPCFISLLYLDLYVLGDDALIS